MTSSLDILLNTLQRIATSLENLEEILGPKEEYVSEQRKEKED
jgi:hypothetical protein